MVCKRCGAKNSDGRKKCFHCGYVFPSDSQENISGVFAVRENEQDNASSPLFSDDDAVSTLTDQTVDETDRSATEENEPSNLEEETFDEIERDEITHLALDREKRETYYEASRNRGGSAYTVAIWILSVLFLITLIVVGVMVFRYLDEQSENTLPPEAPSETISLTAPQIERTTDQDGVEILRAVFYGAPGDRLYLACNDRYYTFVENTLALDLYLNDLFDAEYEFSSPTINASLNAYHVRENKRYPYETLSVSLHVPEADLTLLTVSESTVKVYRDKFTIQLWTQTASRVYLNNTDITSFMDSTGVVSYDVDVHEFSSATYQVRVSQPYHTPKNATFMLTRGALPVNLTLATSNASIISEKTITITGSTEQDATISCNLPLISLEKNEIYNTYTAVADLSSLSYGRQEILITATNSKGSSTRSHVFWYWPDETKITTTANRFNSAVATNANAYNRRNYVLNDVTIKKVIGANEFEAVCTLDGVEYPIRLTYEYRKVNVQIGSVYKVFAACEGAAENGSIKLRVWYLYKQ